MKSMLLASALLATIACGAGADEFSSSDSGFASSGEGSGKPVPNKPNSKTLLSPRRPNATKFVHYGFLGPIKNTMWKMNKLAESPSYNPTMEFGGASIMTNQDGMANAGWDVVYIQTEDGFTTEHMDRAFYAAGYAEGAETQHRIYQNYVNLYPPTVPSMKWDAPKICPKMCQNYIKAQFDWMKTSATAYIASKERDAKKLQFWTSVQNSVNQIQGMIDGYNSTAPVTEELSWMQIYLVGFNFELGDVMHWVNHQMKLKKEETTPSPVAPAAEKETITTAEEEALTFPMRNSHCSALIKVTEKDLFMAHDTWSGFNTMLRQYKTYEFGSSSIPTIAMSSYPGTLHSGDDWYMLSNGLTVQETTNGNMNNTLKYQISNESVPEFVRVMVANRVAEDGQDWTSMFCRQNSGTYNNQFMVVDMNKFNPNGTTPAEKTPAGTLWIVEQAPTACPTKDVTSSLVEKSYWASYNIPNLTNVIMNYTATEKEFGNYFSYTKYARPEIFARGQGNITDLEGMKSMMRYNDYKHDKFSLIQNCEGTTGGKCDPAYSPSLTIASRCDLSPADMSRQTGGPLWKSFKQFAFGAIDSKIVSYSDMWQGMNGHLISGPTTNEASEIKPFVWSCSPFDNAANTHSGMPDGYDFGYFTAMELVDGPPALKPNPLTKSCAAKKKVPKNRIWILAVVVGLVALCVIGSVLFKKHQDKSKGVSGEGEEYTRLTEKKVNDEV